MPSSFSRLRLWLGISALLMVAVVAGFYSYARYRVHKALHDLPAKLGADIQQNTQGFTYSQMAGGHTIFSISASNAVRYKQGGKAELHKVKIVSYGRQSDRLDEITGDDFEYDAQNGDVTAKGRVTIALQATQAGTSSPSGNPKRIGSPLHLETSGLVFNKNAGIAKTGDTITFQLPQGSGSALGATYDSKNNTLDLHSDIHLVTSGPKPMNLQAARGLFRQDEQELTLSDLRAQSGSRSMEAGHVVVHLREDKTVERADASGGVNARVEGPRAALVHASDANFIFGAQNQIASGRLSGGVTWETAGATASRGNAGQVLLAFARDNQIKWVQLREHVDLVQLASGSHPGVAAPQTSTQGNEFRGEGLDLKVGDGTHLQMANSVGAAQILLSAMPDAGRSASTAAKGKTVITASRFDARFSPDNRLSTLTGSTPVKIVSSAPGQPDRVSQSHDLLATFVGGKTQALKDVVQTGSVQIQEAQRTATADRVAFNQSGDALTLSGNVRYKDASTGATLSSNSLTLDRAVGETTATGDVKSTYAEKREQPSGGMLSASQAVHVTAPQMVIKNSTGVARYSGGGRLWQGGNVVQSPVLEFNRNARTLNAQAEGSARVSTVFLQPDKDGKAVPVAIIADHLHYDDSSRKAVFDGAIVVRSADSNLRASKAVVTLRSGAERSKSAKNSGPGAAGELQTIDATGNVLLEQLGRRASGERLIYSADEGKFVLTGTPGAPPSIFDAEHGQITGVSLTFFNRDDRVLVDSSNSTSISQTRLKK